MTARDFIKVFDEYHESIYRFVYFRLYRNTQLAEDLTQDIFTKAWEKRYAFDPAKGEVRTWLYTIARRLIIDSYRKKKALVPLADDGEDISYNDTHIETESLMVFVYTGISKLEELEQELILMRYIEGFELQEIAEIVEKSYDATKKATNRALHKLITIVNGS